MLGNWSTQFVNKVYAFQNFCEHGPPDRCDSDPGHDGQTPVLLHQPPVRLPLPVWGREAHLGWGHTSWKVTIQ